MFSSSAFLGFGSSDPWPLRSNISFGSGNLLCKMWSIFESYYSGHKESNNLHRDIVILRVLRGAELISQSAFERNIQPAWQSLKLLTRRYLNSGQGNSSTAYRGLNGIFVTSAP
jgi:hypothetical protein